MRMFLILALTVLTHTGCSSSQKLIKKIEANSPQQDHLDPILLRSQKNNDLIVAHVVVGSTGGNISYSLFAMKDRNWKAFKYTKKVVFSVGEKAYDLDSVTLNKKQGDSILVTIKKNRSWELMNTDIETKGNCAGIQQKCSMDDGSYEYLNLVTKTHLNSVRFYEPDFYENECCPGWEERQRFISTLKPIKQFFKIRTYEPFLQNLK